MQALEIVDRLKDIVGKYTDDFSQIITATRSLGQNYSNLYYCVTDHGLATNDYVTIRGATKPRYNNFN